MFEVKHLSYSYPKIKSKTIKDVSFSIKKGEIFGFLGPSGAGKSTIQKLLLKLLSHNEGEILYQGKSIRDLGPSFYESIGVSFEMPIHFTKMTALENMHFFQIVFDIYLFKCRNHRFITRDWITLRHVYITREYDHCIVFNSSAFYCFNYG